MRTSPAFRVVRVVLLLLFAVFFFGPLLAMLDFSTRGTNGSRTWAAWANLVEDPELNRAIVASLLLSLFTVVLMLLLLVPTMIWVRLRVPRATRLLEFLCLLPLTIPAIALVVGLAPVYNRIRHYQLSALQLFWAYVILALPYAYRALAAGLGAIDVKTLSEAARSLGASWFTVMVRVIAPNMRQGILNALLLTFALVLGEFTIAYLLLYNNLQAELYSINRNTPNAGVIFSTSFAALLFTFVLLLILSYAGRRRRGRG